MKKNKKKKKKKKKKSKGGHKGDFGTRYTESQQDEDDGFVSKETKRVVSRQ